MVAEANFVASCAEVAVTVAVPGPAGMNTPMLLTVPILAGLTDQLMDWLKFPVPLTIGVQAEVWVVRMDAGMQATETEVIAVGTATATAAEPDLVASCVEVAVMVVAPAVVGVKTPAAVILPPVADQVTPELNAPVPWTFAEQTEVWVVRIEAGAHTTDTEVIATGTAAVTTADPDLVASWVEVAVMVAVPAVVGVKRPEEVMVPPVADQTTAKLSAPAPCTVAEHWLVWPIGTLAGVQVTATESINGEADTKTVALPDLVGS